MLYSSLVRGWNNNKVNTEKFDFTEEEFFSKIPTLNLTVDAKALDKTVQTNKGLYEIEKTDEVLYRENPVDFGSGVWYTMYYTPNGFIFKVEE